MICPKCDNENPESGEFCDNCGASLKQSKVCSSCGAESPQTSRFCDHCGERLRLLEHGAELGAVVDASPLDNNAIKNEEPGERQMPEQKQRHGCLAAVLVVMIIANLTVALLYLAGSAIEDLFLGMPSWLLVLVGFVAIFNLACTIALLKWRKWGFRGFTVGSIIVLCLNLSLGLGPLSFLGLLGIPVLYGVLHMGKENKGWPQLD